MSQSQKLLPLVALSSLALTGCDPLVDKTPDARPTITTTVTVADDSAKPFASIKEAYLHIIQNPEEYPLGEDTANLDDPIEYALVEATMDESPELLLRGGAEELTAELVFTFDEDRGILTQVFGAIVSGVLNDPPGFRTRTMASKSGHGLYSNIRLSASGEETVTHFEIRDSKINSLTKPGGDPFNQHASNQAEIHWFDVDDESGLDALDEASPAEPSIDSNGQGQAAGEDGNYRFTGRVVVRTNEEVMGGDSMPGGESPEDEQVFLVLDAPMEITANTGAGPRSSRTAVMTEVSIGSISNAGTVRKNRWLQFEGQHITIISRPDQVKYPSDASIPLGVLRVLDYVTVE